MQKLIRLSLIINILVLAPVCAGLILNASWCEAAYGPSSAAREILLAVYLAILVTSIVLFARPVPNHVAPLLFVQVVYKVLSPITVGHLVNPVVVSNLLIAAVHSATLVAILRHYKSSQNP